MDSGMMGMGLAGTIVGVAVAGGVGLVRSVTETWLPGVVASSGHKREFQATLQSHRHELVREWRAGMAGARDTYRRWAAGPRDADAPNVVGDEWFESLRPHLSTTGDHAQYRTAHDVQCDNPTVILLSLEIGRIDKEWIDEACGRRRRRRHRG